MLFQVLRNINRMHYRPITNKNQHGSTYTAQAMEHALKEIFTAEAGWRNGTTGGAEPVKVKIIMIFVKKLLNNILYLKFRFEQK